MSIETMLDDTMDVERQTASRDSSGGSVRTWNTVYTGIACHVTELNASQRMSFAMLRIEASHAAITEQAGIENGDRLRLSDGVLVRVTGIEKRRATGNIDTYFKVLGVEIKL